MTDKLTPEDQNILAAEFALGLLEDDELADAQARLRTDSDFAAEVADWEISFAQVADGLEPIVPSASIKKALMGRLFDGASERGFSFTRWLWPVTTLAALLVAAMLLVTDITGPDQNSGPFYTAEIASAEGDFRVVAVVDKSTNEVILTKTLGGAPEGRQLQVWAHGPGEPAESVGLWAPGATTIRLPLPPRIAAVTGVLTLGMSEEPPGGSTTGGPSGRVFGTVDIPGVVSDI